MQATNPAAMLAAAMAPLGTAFGAKLECSRAHGVVTWCFCGQSVRVVENGSHASATFVGAPATERASGASLSPVYARGTSRYELDARGAERLVADMYDFFSGSREPAFVFTGIE